MQKLKSVENGCWLTLFFLLIPFATLQGQDDVGLLNYWQYYSDAENALYKNFCSTAFEQLEERETIVHGLKTKEDWMQRQKVVREKLLHLIGPFPEKTALNIQLTGTLLRDGYRVEKLIYESQPGYFVTAALFIPDKLKGKAPAILNPIGHSTPGFRRDIYQHTIINLVKKGFIVLTYDPVGQGERLQYYDPATGNSRFASTREHSYPGAQCFISGYSPAKYFIWDGIRGIDVLMTRPEVDPERIGITGLSGGGTSTAQIAAVDERILAAAPECYITNFKYLLSSRGPQDAEQNLFHFIFHGLDHPDFIEVRAPNPTLIISTTRDFFSIQGARETYQEASGAYNAMGALGNLQMTEDDSGHGFTTKNREAMYAFFQKHLENPGDPSDLDVETVPPEELWVTKTGQLATSLEGETIFTLNGKMVKKQVAQLESNRKNPEEHLQGVNIAAARISGFEYPRDMGQEVFSGRMVNDTYLVEKYLIKGSNDCVIPLVVLYPSENMKKKVVLLLHEKGKDYAVNSESLAKRLVSDGYTVVTGDLPGIGELGPGFLKGDAYLDDVSYNLWFAGILTGKSIVGIRAENIIRMGHFIENNLADHHSISLLSLGVLGSETLHASVFDDVFQDVCLLHPFLSYTEIALSSDYSPSYIPSTVAGAIQSYDLTDLMAAFHPRKLLVINPLSANGKLANEQHSREALAFPLRVYAREGNSKNLELVFCQENQQVFDQILNWLNN